MSTEQQEVKVRGRGVLDVVKVLVIGLVGATVGITLLLVLLFTLISQNF